MKVYLTDCISNFMYPELRHTDQRTRRRRLARHEHCHKFNTYGVKYAYIRKGKHCIFVLSLHTDTQVRESSMKIS